MNTEARRLELRSEILRMQEELDALETDPSWVDELDLGVYRLHWVDGGTTLACVGFDYSGARWLACSNWTSRRETQTRSDGTTYDYVKTATFEWADVIRAEPIALTKHERRR